MALFGGKDGKDDRERPAPAADPAAGGAEAAPAAPRRAPPAQASRSQSPPLEVEKMANVGKSITIKGDISGDEDLLVEGKVEGKVDLPEHQLTVGANGVCEASVNAKTVIVTGRIAGDVTGIERVEIQSSGVVDGDVRAPRLVVEEGAVLNGSISMTKQGAATGTTAKPKPATPEQPKQQASGGFATP